MIFQENHSPFQRLRQSGSQFAPARIVKALRGILRTPFDDRHDALTAQVERLRALDDRDLARMGLRREDILWHVFACRKI